MWLCALDYQWRVADNCELPVVGAGNQNQVLCKRTMGSCLATSPAPIVVLFYFVLLCFV